MRRDEIINPDEYLLHGLNPYETMILISTTERSLGGYNLALTKDGGIWPILLTELSLKYILSEEDVASALKYAVGKYKNYLGRARHHKYSDDDWVIRYRLLHRRPDTFPFQLSRPEFNMIQNFIYSIPSVPKATPTVSRIIRVSFKRYNQTINSLVQKGLIEDPWEYLGLLILGFIPLRFNRETVKGKRTSQELRALLWGFRKSISINEHGEEVEKEEYYFRLFELWRKFLVGLEKELQNGDENKKA